MKLVTINQNNNTLSMTSREIAALTNKEHKHVKRDIEVMLEQLDLDKSNFGRIYLDSLNRQQTEYALDRELTEVLVTGYSPKLRLAVIRRLKELEQQIAKPVLPTTYLEALKALISSEEQKQVIQHQLEAAAPKINHYDTVVERFNLMTATQVGQKLGMTANKLNKHLEELGAYNKSVKRGRAFKQWFIDEGYGVMKEANKGYSQALITSKGQAYIVQELTFNKAVPEADIERIEARTNHTANAIQYVNNLLEY